MRNLSVVILGLGSLLGLESLLAGRRLSLGLLGMMCESSVRERVVWRTYLCSIRLWRARKSGSDVYYTRTAP